MSFSAVEVTNAGLTLINQAITGGGAVSITSVQVGSGFPGLGENLATYTALKAFVMNATITSINSSVLYQSTVRINVNSAIAPSTFQVNEIGVFANVGGGTPVLFAYASTGGTTGDTITPGSAVVRAYAVLVTYSQSVPTTTLLTLTPQVDLHAPTHLDNGVDPIPVSTVTRTGSLPRLSGNINDTLHGDGTWQAGFMPGMLIDYGGATAPAGWLLCDGTAYSRTTYSALFVVIGTAYGVGNGSSTFNVPDFRGRSAIGTGQGANLTNRARGELGGEENHTLILSEVPGHSHTIIEPNGGAGHGHTIPATTHTHSIPATTHSHTIPANSHNHGLTQTAHTHHVSILGQYGYAAGTVIGGAPSNVLNQLNPGVGGTDNSTVAGHPADAAMAGVGILASSIGITAVAAAGIGISAVTAAGTNITATNTGVTGITNASSGGGAGHNVMHPYLVATKIIKV